MEQQLKETAARKQLHDVVTFHGAMPPERVRAHMEQAGIYLFTSDRKEGWGAVLNEAMNSACAVVASCDAGSTPYLVKDGLNGTVYTACRVSELCEKMKYLLDHPSEQKHMGIAAYETIVQDWNPEAAAERLTVALTQILNGDTSLAHFSEGPCSRA
jgi:glycosyltransferase involved in cell wall biosynthesis